MVSSIHPLQEHRQNGLLEIKIYSSPETDWQLDLDGSDIGGIKTNISKTYLEQALACQFGSEHKATYTDTKGMSGRACRSGSLQDLLMMQISTQIMRLTKALAYAGYSMVITGGDGYNTTIYSKEIIRSSNYLVANSLNGAHIADTDENWPLRFTGANVSGSMTVKGVRSIRLVPTTSTPSLTVTSPNGGETWQRNTSHTVTWSYTGSPGSTVKIVCLKAGAE